MTKAKAMTGSSATSSGRVSSRVSMPRLRRPMNARSSAGSARRDTVSDNRCDSGGRSTLRCSAVSGGASSGLIFATTIT